MLEYITFAKRVRVAGTREADDVRGRCWAAKAQSINIESDRDHYRCMTFWINLCEGNVHRGRVISLQVTAPSARRGAFGCNNGAEVEGEKDLMA